MKNPRDIIVKPVISEKSTDLLADNKYTFWVNRAANKVEIRQAIEKLFDVSVEKVYTLNVKGRKKRVRQFIGKTPDRKKAIVKLAEGEKIEIFEGL
ncbi:MAG: 50S ribosomal protein L23 [Firmicutes bacterium]|nr:50S ribosomal protein L23 [Bacillota bacterium]